ncbi:hypothetical protein DMH04_31090 [Kibdelosporangium aridum]|uniref:Uncharacterized protein n=2 Tax=Kibdelosporangium aridum TaxID=2030 RepID=A0A428Z2X7_KIBAR|nr:hypothetical protein DMH04_31090 [Kibdelosporangium aridum]
MITGTVQQGSVSYAVRWERNGSITKLDALPGGQSAEGTEINDTGMIVGWSLDAGGESRPVRWAADGSVTDLGVLRGHVWGYAEAVSNNGMAVGRSIGTNVRGVRWSR